MVDLNDFNFQAKQSEWETFYSNHGLLNKAPLLKNSLIEKNIMVFKERPKSYETAILSDFIRHKMIETKDTFSFESVFSHPSKLDFLKIAHKYNYKCYLYFAATSSPEICVNRVKQRVLEGGHAVPVDKIRSRYSLSLQNLLPAMRLAYRVFLFDNSHEMKLVAEMHTDKTLELKDPHMPIWVQEYVLNKL